MRKIVISGWNVGFDKVGFTKLMRHDLGYPLSRAKGVTDTVLERKPVTIKFEDKKLENLVLKLNQLGARFEVGDEGAIPTSDEKRPEGR